VPPHHSFKDEQRKIKRVPERHNRTESRFLVKLSCQYSWLQAVITPRDRRRLRTPMPSGIARRLLTLPMGRESWVVYLSRRRRSRFPRGHNSR
jgi:hypothetical protein